MSPPFYVYINEKTNSMNKIRPGGRKGGSTMNDISIVELYWKRSEQAILETSNKYGKLCHGISYNILRNEQDAEECVNDTWLRAWNSMPPNRPSRLSIFLGRITRNLSLDKYRCYSAEKRLMTRTAEALEELEECISGGDNVSEAVMEMVLTESIERFLNTTSEEKRNIFIRRYWYLDSIKDISMAYGITENKTTAILFRMRGQLQKHLVREGIEL